LGKALSTRKGGNPARLTNKKKGKKKNETQASMDRWEALYHPVKNEEKRQQRGVLDRKEGQRKEISQKTRPLLPLKEETFP